MLPLVARAIAKSKLRLEYQSVNKLIERAILHKYSDAKGHIEQSSSGTCVTVTLFLKQACLFSMLEQDFDFVY